MKRLLVLAATFAGTSAIEAEATQTHPIYASRPNSRIAFDEYGAITNFSATGNGHDRRGSPHAGIQLAGKGAAQAQSAAEQDSKGQKVEHRQAIYGHNVDDVVIGNLSGAHPGKTQGATGQRAIIYNGTITSEPTNTLACSHSTGAHASGVGVRLKGARTTRNCKTAKTYTKPEPAVTDGHKRK